MKLAMSRNISSHGLEGDSARADTRRRGETSGGGWNETRKRKKTEEAFYCRVEKERGVL